MPRAPPLAQLRLQPVGTQWQARIDNRLAGPLQIQLRRPRTHRSKASVESLIQGDSSLVVGHLPAPIEGRMLDLRLQSVPGNPAAQAEDVAIACRSMRPAWTRRHRGDSAMTTENRDAVDFALPEGTLVLAAREGTVMQIRMASVAMARTACAMVPVPISSACCTATAACVRPPPGRRHARAPRPGGGSRATDRPVRQQRLQRCAPAVVQVNRGMGLRSVPVRIFAEQGQLQFARQGEADGGTGR